MTVEILEAGSWPAIWRAVRKLDIPLVLDELLHAVENLEIVPDWVWEVGDWRGRYCTWATTRKIKWEDD